MIVENSPYPPDDRVVREAAALTAAGYRVSVICPQGRSQPLRERLHGVEVFRYPAIRSGDSFLGYVREYGYALLASFALSVRALVRPGFDVVHLHNPPDLLVLVAGLYKLLGKRIVFDHHDLAPEMYDARFPGGGSRVVRAVLVAFERASCRMADHVITTNESYRQVEMERDGVPAERITIVRNGPDLDRLRAVDSGVALLPADRLVLGYVGVMGYQDGVDYLLRAVYHLVHDLGRHDALCVCIGRGDAWDDLRRLAEQLGITANVRFTGFVPDAEMVAYLSRADICVDPDPSNPFTERSTMIKMMEYMALAKPIVAFDLREHRFTAGAAASYVEPNDEQAFARAIAELADDPERRQAMGQLGRQRIVSELAWEHAVPGLLAAYAKVIARD